MSPSAREHLRRVLIHDQTDRDAIASNLLRYRDQRGDDWADIIECPDPQLVPRRLGSARKRVLGCAA